MKSIFSIVYLALFSVGVNAQMKGLEWFTNMEMAKEYAAENDKDILMVFSGSDWCRPCIQFKQDILEEADFQDWGSERFVILYLDFPARKKNRLSEEAIAHNEALAERLNKSGAFPNIYYRNSYNFHPIGVRFNYFPEEVNL